MIDKEKINKYAREYGKKRRDKKRLEKTGKIDYIRQPAKDGTRTFYTYGCRCEACKKAAREWMKKYREDKKVVDKQ